MPLNTLTKKTNSQQNQHFHTDRKRFNSFQVNKESLKLDKLKNQQRTAKQLSPVNATEQKQERLKEVNKRYSAVPNKGKAPPISKSFRASSNHPDKI